MPSTKLNDGLANLCWLKMLLENGHQQTRGLLADRLSPFTHVLTQINIFNSLSPARCGCNFKYAHFKHNHDDVIKWKHFPRYWPFVLGIHRSPVNSPHNGQWRGALMFSLICIWINGWVNNREAGNLRRYRVHYDVTVMVVLISWVFK